MNQSVIVVCVCVCVFSALREDDMVAELRHLVQRVQKCCDDMKMEEERYEDVSGLGRRWYFCGGCQQTSVLIVGGTLCSKCLTPKRVRGSNSIPQ